VKLVVCLAVAQLRDSISVEDVALIQSVKHELCLSVAADGADLLLVAEVVGEHQAVVVADLDLEHD